MTRHLNLALLIFDTPIPAVQAAHGTYLDIFRTHLRKSLKSVLKSKGEPVDSVQFTLDGYDVVEQVYPDEAKLGTYDGIILSGSGASAYGSLPWIPPLLDFVVQMTRDHPKIKIFGICFGHQIIARALGGRCVPNEKGWEVGVFDVQLNELGEKIFGCKELRMHQMHRALVPDTHIPSGFEIIGATPACSNQGMVLRYPDAKNKAGYGGIHVFTLQGHPEFHESIVSKIVDAKEQDGLLNSSEAADGRRRAPLEHDGVAIIGRVMWGILGVS
ncbi:class I glutamine amidotransferase-like protein [Rhizoctonia solani]|nr:class I glutamine amidotransferase-like protein [Rhizoctonia solani]